MENPKMFRDIVRDESSFDIVYMIGYADSHRSGGPAYILESAVTFQHVNNPNRVAHYEVFDLIILISS